MSLSISFKLTGRGWADCNILIDNQLTVLTASYLDNALGNLAEATLRIAQGEELAYAVFAEEPGEYLWKLREINESDLSVEILWLDDWKPNEYSDQKGNLVLQFECLKIQFIRRIIICLSDTLNEYGLEGYKNEWVSNEFPLEVYNKLREILPELK
jgi:hypothetical protein